MNSYLPAFGATPPSAISFAGGFDIQKVRMGFPILDQWVHDKPLVYLDSAATMVLSSARTCVSMTSPCSS